MSAFETAFLDLSAALDGSADTVLVLPLELVVEDAAQPRTTFDEAEIDSLAATVRERGVLQPITVGPQQGDGTYPLRFGARRLRAARRAGLTEIRALVRAGAADEAEAIAEQVIENDQRAGLTTGEMAVAVDRLLKFGKTQAEVVRLLGRPKDQVAMLAAVAKRPPVLEPLGATLGLRTLYELQNAWKQDAAAVERWVEARPAEAITQADARALAAGLAGAGKGRAISKEANRPPEVVAAPQEIRGRSQLAPEVRRRPRPAQDIRVSVALERRSGRLLLDRPGEPGCAWVLFDGAQEAELVPVGQLKLTAVEIG